MRERLTTYQEDALHLIMDHPKTDPIWGKDIANTIGLTKRKSGMQGADLRSIIHALRVKGYPICASGKGYWWPSSHEELSAYIMSFEFRVLDQSKALEGLKKGFVRVNNREAVKEEVEGVKTRYFRALDGKGELKVFQIENRKVDAFLTMYPNAEEL